MVKWKLVVLHRYFSLL